ncbi:MAG: hypothetical protein MMC33_006977 [Icmadophila ericetorum]|nr:hypothetical protein [Icmadophila ericetorum]
MSSSSGKAKASRQKFAFEDLPLETQKDIFSWVPQKSLLTLQLVSQHFHQLASARLYSNLKFVFSHADASSNYSKPKTRLTDVLHTFATSEHDYAQYVKTFALQLSDRDDDIPSRVPSRFHFDEDATKLLNTTLLLMLRKANTLEAFIWDPSVELNGHVYRALCNINTLQYFHVRLDSLDPPKPPIGPPGVPPPSQSLAQAYYPGHPHSGPIPGLASLRSKPKLAPPPNNSGKRKFSTFKGLKRLEILGIDDVGESLSEIAACVTGSSSTLKSLTLSLSQELARRARRTTPSAPTMSAAANADMDDDDDDDDAPTPPETPAAPAPSNDADVRKERAAQESVLAILFGLEPAAAADRKVDKLLKASAASLKSVEDSNHVFMSELRKIIGQLVQSKSTTPASIAKDKHHVLDLLEKAAEKYLQSDVNKKQKKPLPPPPPSTSKNHSSSHNWASTIPNGSTQHYTTASLSHSSKIEDQFQQQYNQYLANNPGALAEELDFEAIVDAQVQSAYAGSPSFGGNPLFADELFADLPHVPVTPSMLSSAGFHQVGSSGSSPSWIPSLNGHSIFPSSHGNKLFNPSVPLPNSVKHQILQQVIQKQSLNGSNSHPQDDSSDDTETEDEKEVAEESSGDAKAPFFPAIEPSTQDKEDAMDIDMEHPDVIESDDDIPDQEIIEEPEEFPKPSASILPMQSTAASSSTSLNLPASSPKPKPRSSMSKQTKKKAKKPKTNEETMQDYLRTTHGFHLEEFSLYLIPVKASVIARGLDLSCLQRLTLLNVGPQGGFWTLVDKVRRESVPIQLKYIHTDDASLAFLNCISQFSGLVDLFVMKRSSKEADGLTSKTTATITDIRILALRKHISTLKRLMIMNMNIEDDSWDLDSKALRLLTAKGSGLLELGISVSMNDYHILMQTLPGLRSLIALHILQIRTQDHCHSVTRECRKFTIDTLSHCPGLRIRYLVMQNMVWVLGPRKSGSRGSKRVKIDVKGKGKSVGASGGSTAGGVSSSSKGKGKAVDFSGVDVAGDEATLVEEDFEEIESGNLEMTSLKQLKFWEVEGIKIFEKEIRTGTL